MTATKKSRPRIPITAITGFLGAGKTTLINHLLTHNEGLRFGVVVNDYGDINIDSKLIAGQTDTKLELTNGCICCSLETLDLQSAIDQFTHESAHIDHIIIEASGLAQPKDLALTLKNTIGVRVRLDAIVLVLDAFNLERNAVSSELATEQIEYTDYVVINKLDLIDTTKIKQIRKLIRAINPKARILESLHGAIDLRLILDRESFGVDQSKNNDKHHHKHIHEDFATFSFTSERPLQPFRFQEFVNNKLPTSVYRAKGFIDLGHKGHQRKYILQVVGTRAEITYDNWHNETPHTELVFIGQNMPKQQILDSLTACIDDAPDSDMTDMTVQLPRKSVD